MTMNARSYRKDVNLQVHDVDDCIHPVDVISNLVFQLDILPSKGVLGSMAPSWGPLPEANLSVVTFEIDRNIPLTWKESEREKDIGH